MTASTHRETESEPDAGGTSDGMSYDRIAGAAAIGAILAIYLLYLVAPETVWDHFFYRHFWGPVEADAGVDPTVPGEDPEARYNPISTLGYGMLMAGGVYLIYAIFGRFRIDIDWRFILATIPYILVGPFARALEDADMFGPPFVFFAISPVIYVALGLFAAGMCVYSFVVPERYLKRNDDDTKFTTEDTEGRRGKTDNVLILFELLPYALFTIFYTVIFHFSESDFTFLYHPAAIVLVSVIACAAHLFIVQKRPERMDGTMRFFAYGVYFLVVFVLFYLPWLFGMEDIIGDQDGNERYPEVVPVIIVLALLATALTREFYRRALPVIVGADRKELASSLSTVFTSRIALMLFAAHYLDAAATFVGIDFYDYREKHVLPLFLIDLTGSAAVMFVLKFAVISIIIFTMDYYYRDDMAANPRLAGLMRIAVLILGLAPGTRDMLRNAAGI